MQGFNDNDSFTGFDSDVEGLSSSAIRDHYSLANDYWLGRHFWGYHVAAKICAANTNAMSNPDAVWAEKMRTFPHERCVQELRSHLSPAYDNSMAGKTAYEDLLTLLGTVQRLQDLDAKQQVLDNIAEHLERLATHTNQEAPLSGAREPDRGSTSTRAGYAPPINHDQLPRYTMALYEHLARSGEHIDWRMKQMSLYPPSFIATANIQGASFEGEATGKKLARHLAAVKVCQYLNIELE